MNYLILMGLLIFGSSCTNYSPIGKNGSEEEVPETENVYLELDLHQIYLERRDAQLVVEIEQVMVNLENKEGNEEDNMSLLEELQEEKATNTALFEYNMAVLDEIDNRIAFRRPPKLPCSDEGEPDINCPIPGLRSVNLWIFEGQEIQSAVQEGEQGEIYGKLAGLDSVEGLDGFSVMVFEQSGEGVNPTKLIISKQNPIGDGMVSYTSFYE